MRGPAKVNSLIIRAKKDLNNRLSQASSSVKAAFPVIDRHRLGRKD
jgi:hypothetical protein